MQSTFLYQVQKEKHLHTNENFINTCSYTISNQRRENHDVGLSPWSYYCNTPTEISEIFRLDVHCLNGEIFPILEDFRKENLTLWIT